MWAVCIACMALLLRSMLVPADCMQSEQGSTSLSTCTAPRPAWSLERVKGKIIQKCPGIMLKTGILDTSTSCRIATAMAGWQPSGEGHALMYTVLWQALHMVHVFKHSCYVFACSPPISACRGHSCTCGRFDSRLLYTNIFIDGLSLYTAHVLHHCQMISCLRQIATCMSLAYCYLHVSEPWQAVPCRRRPPQQRTQRLQSLEESSALRNLSDFTDTMAHWMAILGMFAQGLCGGLALIAFFMTYLLFATQGATGFLQYYSALALNVNRTFFTLISLSVVAAVSKLAFDKLGNFQPMELR